jgi:hypothetical protein
MIVSIPTVNLIIQIRKYSCLIKHQFLNKFFSFKNTKDCLEKTSIDYWQILAYNVKFTLERKRKLSKYRNGFLIYYSRNHDYADGNQVTIYFNNQRRIQQYSK